MTDTRFALGRATAYVTDTVLALGATSGVDELMQLAAATDWSTLAGTARERGVTALVMHDGGSLRVGVAGDASIVVRTSDGDRRFDGGESWCTDTVEHAQVVTLAADRHAVPDTDPRSDVDVDIDVDLPYRTDAGVVPASVVRRRIVAVGTEPPDPFELLFGHTVVRSVESAAIRPSVADRTPHTALGVLVFATGERVVVDRPIVLGRNPNPVDDDAPHPRLVTLSQPGVSRRHAAIRVDRWTASIDDLGSANGTTIALPGRPAVALRPGHPVDLQAGAVVDLGGEVSFVVEEAA